MSSSDHLLTWTIGSVRITRVEERVVDMPWGGLIPTSPELVDGCQPWISPFMSADHTKLLLSVHSFVVTTPETCIVVDTCIGRDDLSIAGDAGFGDRLAEALPGGFEAVDIVVCTHLHFDHVGWNTVEVDGRLQPRFPNARYLVTAAELAAERDQEDGRAFAASIQPLLDGSVLDVVEPDHRIDSWVVLASSPGHTPGHVSVRIADGAAQAAITGDLVHSPLQFAHPEASTISDNDPALATTTRERVVDELADTGVLVLGTHFPPPTSGHIRRSGRDVSFEVADEPTSP